MPLSSPAQKALRRAVRAILEALAGIALREGLSVGDLRSILEDVMVRRAEAYLASVGKKPTYSSIAVVTGLTRNVVRSVLESDKLEPSRRSEQATDRALRVLTGWHEDPEFLDSRGRPTELVLRGNRNSFEALALRYGGGISHLPLLDRLLDMKSARVSRRDKEGRPVAVRALRATLRSDSPDGHHYTLLGQVIADGIDAFSKLVDGTGPAERVEPQTFSAVILDEGDNLQKVRRALRLRCDNTVAAMDRVVCDYEPKLPLSKSHADQDKLFDVRISVLATVKRSFPDQSAPRRAWRRRKLGN